MSSSVNYSNNTEINPMFSNNNFYKNTSLNSYSSKNKYYRNHVKNSVKNIIYEDVHKNISNEEEIPYNN